MPPDQPDFFGTPDADPPAPPATEAVDVPSVESAAAEPAAPPATPMRKPRRRAPKPPPSSETAPEPAPASPWHGHLAHVTPPASPPEPEAPAPEPPAPASAPSAVQQVLQAGRETRLAAWPPVPAAAPASFAVLIPNWNGAAFIERCLASVLAALRQAGLSGAPILVHDDASDDDSVARIAASFPQVLVIQSEANVGFGESVNRLMRVCTAEWVYLLNNDLALATDFCARLRQTLDAYLAGPAASSPRPLMRPLVRVNRTASATVIAARTASAVPLLYAIGAQTCDWATHEPNHGGQHVAWRDGLLAQEPFESAEAAPAGFFQAGACLIHRAHFLELGGFPALFHPGYWEDYDSAWAARASGWAVLYEPRAIAYHCGKGSMRRRYGAFGVSLMLKRNHLLFNWVNLHDGDLLARHLLALPRLVWRGADGPGEAGWGRALLAALQRLPDVLRLRADRRRRALLAERDLLGAGENMDAPASAPAPPHD